MGIAFMTIRGIYALVALIKGKTDNLPAAPADQATALAAASDAEVAESHFHNYEQAFGVAAVPTATHWGDPDSLTPFVATSGNGAFGAETQVLGPADTPFRAGMTYFDPREWSIIDVSKNTPYIVRVIWGTPAQTVAQAETLKQYSAWFVHQLTAAGNNKPQEGRIVRVPAGSQLWVKVKNATNLATMSFGTTIHEYPSPSP